MRHEIGDSHLSRAKECNRPRRETDDEQAAANDFNPGGDHQYCWERVGDARLRAGKLHQFHEAMLNEEQGRHHT
jgi:hypothetical protein